VAGRSPSLAAASPAVDPSPWRSRIGLELYTVRNLLAADFEGTLAKVADIGFTEVEPTTYNNMSPTAFRALLVHSHTGEFEKLTDSPKTAFDVLVEDTDPALVTMQLDLGWTYIAGVDPIALFKAHPGRFELWHVKDVFGLKTVNPSLGPNARVSFQNLADMLT
jgi:hypothetical protein